MLVHSSTLLPDDLAEEPVASSVDLAGALSVFTSKFKVNEQNTGRDRRASKQRGSATESGEKVVQTPPEPVNIIKRSGSYFIHLGALTRGFSRFRAIVAVIGVSYVAS